MYKRIFACIICVAIAASSFNISTIQVAAEEAGIAQESGITEEGTESSTEETESGVEENIDMPEISENEDSNIAGDSGSEETENVDGTSGGTDIGETPETGVDGTNVGETPEGTADVDSLPDSGQISSGEEKTPELQSESEKPNVLAEQVEQKEQEEADARADEQEQDSVNLDSMADENRSVLSDGVYYIRTDLNERQVIEPESASAKNKTNIVISQFDKTSSQRWSVIHDDKGYITFINENTGKVLDVADGGRNGSRSVWQYTNNGTPAQKWIAVKDGTNYQIVSALNPDWRLSISGGFAKISETDNTSAQRFQMINTNPVVPACEEHVKSGWYYIIPALDDSYMVDVKGKSGSNKANIQLEKADKNFSQMFYLKYENGYYSIRNRYSGRMLDIEMGGFMPATNVWQYNDNATKAQRWSLQKNEDGSYTFISLHNGMALDISGGVAYSGSNVQVYTPNQSAAQKFNLMAADDNELDKLAAANRDAMPDGIYYLRTALNNKKVVDVKGASKSNRAGAVVKEFAKAENQRWKVVHDESGYVTFINEKSGKVLDVADGGRNGNHTVWQWGSNNTFAQKWIVQKNGSYYRIISALDKNLVLDVQGGSSDDNTQVQIYQQNNTDSQNFQFISAAPAVPKCEEKVPSGIYYICSKANENYALDISNGSNANKANVQLYKANSTFAQAFELEYKDGYYSIRNLYSNRMLDIEMGGFMPTTNVWQYNDNSTKAQKWSLQDNGDGSYTFISLHNGMALDVSGGTIASGSNIQVYTPNQTVAQKFVLKPAEQFYAGTYNIKTVTSGRVAEIQGGNTGNKTPIQLYNHNGTDSQKWSAVRNSDGTFRFVNVKSGKILDISNGTITSGNGIWAWQYNGTPAQKWKVERLEDNTWRIVSMKDENYVLSLENTSGANKSKLVIKNWSGSPSQKWTFEKTSSTKRLLEVQIDEGNEHVIEKGSQYQLTAREIFTTGQGTAIAWKSSDNSVVQVSDSGRVSGLRSGYATVTATSKTDRKKLARIRVYVAEQNGELEKETLDKMQLDNINKLMIVAHPDDETFWGGGHILQDNYVVVCITNGWNSVRKREFLNAMEFSGEKAIILDYPDLSDGSRDNWEYCKTAIRKDIETVVNYKEWETIAVHNPEGEYGHIHHQMTSTAVTEVCKEYNMFEHLYYFGKYYSKGKVPSNLQSNLSPEIVLQKRKMCELYASQYSSYKRNWIQMEEHEHWVKAAEW